jgi:regulatory protein
MKIISLKVDAKRELARIELSDKSLFSFRVCYLPVELNDSLNTPEMGEREISDEEEGAFRFAASCLRAERAASRLIARAEQCSRGLCRKLEKRGFQALCVNAVISRLLELALIDDRRFARLWLESKMRLARSPRRLLVSLCARGIDRDDAEAALKEVLDEETEMALLSRFIKKAFKKNNNIGETALKQLKFKLKNEGFSNQAIARLQL